MTFLYILLGIIAFFVIVLSVPVHISIGYDNKIRVSIRYLFVKLNILPAKQKPKKEKPPKEPKPEKEKSPDKEKPKEKKPNPILEMVKANGYDGMMTIIGNLCRIMKIYGGKLFKSVVFDEIDLYISVGTGDAASTAIKYGETCQKVYPPLGFICSNNIVRKYDINVEPDFLANKTQSEFYCDFHICIRKIINASIAMAVRLVFGVVITFIRGGKKKPVQESSDTNNQPKVNSMKG